MNAIRHSLMSSAAAVRNADAACYHGIFTYAVGCDHVDRSCRFCCVQQIAGTYRQFAEKNVTRRLKDGRYIWNGHLWIADPLDDEVWLKPQQFLGSGKFIFVNLMSDVCHPKIPTAITRLGFWAIAASAHYGMHCTKRPERMAAIISAASAEEERAWKPKSLLGFTAGDQARFDQRWSVMRPLAEQGWFVYASLSPLLQPITLPPDYLALARWTILSGEQGDPDRVADMDPDWAGAVLDQCDGVNMPFFFREMSGGGPIPNKLLRRDFPDLSHDRKQGLGVGPVNLPGRASPKQQQTTLINLRGTNGAGKSTVVRNLLDANDARPLYGALGQRPEAYVLSLPDNNKAYVIGPYETPCGGCDAIQPYSLICPLIERYAALGNVIFEGALISSCWGEIGRLLERFGHQALVVFLDTPLDVCVDRVQARRQQRGDSRPFNPANLTQKFNTIARRKQKLDAAGTVRTVSVSSENAAAVIAQGIF
jgi:protein gp37